jgi:succinate-semialdehyde dehydrogenase/glutarate-semialdehyde dehydrogenase
MHRARAGPIFRLVLEVDSRTTTDRDIEPTARPTADGDALGPTLLPLVDGGPCGGTGLAETLVDPATGEPFARVQLAGHDDVDLAAESAARSSALWRNAPFEERGQGLRRLADLIYSNAQPIARLIAREQGKPYVEALTLEVLPALDHLRFIIRHAERYHAGLAVDPRHPFYAHKRAHYLYDAIGVVAVVTPSPLPFAVPLIQVAAALAMGNAVVLKPSERTPLCGLRIGELCMQAGFPAGLVNVIPAGHEDALRLVAHDRVDKAFYTGSLVGGQHVMAAAGCTPRPVVLALGGKHASVVAGDANVERAARGIVWGALANAGQNCGSIERVYVEERVASRFLERLLAEVDKVRMGNPLGENVDLGPLITEARRRAVHDQVTEAVQRGARLMRGGEIPEGPGFFYPPTVLLEPPHDCRVMREETLGPVIPICVVESSERAILLANDSSFALTASGWTASPEQAERLMVGLQAGVVTINDVLYSFGEPASTWSGFRKSGLGQNHGTPGLREMSRQRFVSYDGSPAEAPVFAYPYDEQATEIAHESLERLHGQGRFPRLRALYRLLRSKRFRARVPARSLLAPKKHQK